MEFGLTFTNVIGFGSPDAAIAAATAAEAAGFDSLWTVEHVVVPAGYQSTYPYSETGRMPGPEQTPICDPLIWLAYVAAATNRIKLATGILILPERQAAVVAKEVATLDVLSRGRVVLGVGAGWLKEEFDVLGVPFERRGERLDSYIGALRELWTGEPVTIHDDFLSVDKAISQPRPANGTVPIHIGGHTEVAARRAGRLGDGFCPAKGDLPRLLEVMRKAARDAGRDPDAIEVSAGPGIELFGPDPLDEVKRLADLGVHRIYIPPLAWDTEGIKTALAKFGDDVIAKV